MSRCCSLNVGVVVALSRARCVRGQGPFVCRRLSFNTTTTVPEPHLCHLSSAQAAVRDSGPVAVKPLHLAHQAPARPPGANVRKRCATPTPAAVAAATTVAAS